MLTLPQCRFTKHSISCLVVLIFFLSFSNNLIYFSHFLPFTLFFLHISFNFVYFLSLYFFLFYLLLLDFSYFYFIFLSSFLYFFTFFFLLLSFYILFHTLFKTNLINVINLCKSGSFVVVSNLKLSHTWSFVVLLSYKF